MNIMNTMREILKREEISASDASRKMGRSPAYVGNLINPHSHKDVQASTAVKFCEAMGYELVARSKEDGYEFLIDE